MAYITILFLLVLLVINWKIFRNIISPAVITNAVWLILLAIYNTVNHILYPLSDKFYCIIIIWNIGFSISSMFCRKIKLKIPEACTYVEKEGLYRIFLPLMVICLIISIYGKIQIGLHYNSSNIFAGIYAHSVLSFDGTSNFNLPFYYSIAQELCTYSIAVVGSLLFFRKKKAKLIVFTLLLLFVFTILRSNKFSICQLLFFFFSMKILATGISRKVILYFFGSFVVLMVVGHIIRSSNSGGNGFNIVNMLALYLLSPLPAFDYVLNAPIDLIENFNGEYTFRAFLPYLNLLGFNLVGNSDPFNLHFWTYTPIHTNVYTALFNFYVDFGLIGIIFASVFYGLIFGLLWKGCIKKVPLFIIAYSSMIYILIFQFFGEFLMIFFWVNFLPFVFYVLYFTHFSIKLTKVMDIRK